MNYLTEANVCNRWLEECGRIDPIYPVGEGAVPSNAGYGRVATRFHPWRVSINDVGHLIYREGKRTVEMARFVGERRLLSQHGGAVLLNGDGFTANVSAFQTRLRDRARDKFALQHVMIVPYMALTGAELEYDSILPIHVSGDTITTNRVILPSPPIRPSSYDIGRHRRLGRTITHNGREWRWIWNGPIALQVTHQAPNG